MGKGGAVSSRSFDLLNSMIYDLKISVDQMLVKTGLFWGDFDGSWYLSDAGEVGKGLLLLERFEVLVELQY